MKDTVVMTVVQVWLAGCLVGAGAKIRLQKSLLKAYNGKFTTPIQPKAARFRRTELILYLRFSGSRPMARYRTVKGLKTSLAIVFNKCIHATFPYSQRK